MVADIAPDADLIKNTLSVRYDAVVRTQIRRTIPIDLRAFLPLGKLYTEEGFDRHQRIVAVLPGHTVHQVDERPEITVRIDFRTVFLRLRLQSLRRGHDLLGLRTFRQHGRHMLPRLLFIMLFPASHRRRHHSRASRNRQDLPSNHFTHPQTPIFTSNTNYLHYILSRRSGALPHYYSR